MLALVLLVLWLVARVLEFLGSCYVVLKIALVVARVDARKLWLVAKVAAMVISRVLLGACYSVLAGC